MDELAGDDQMLRELAERVAALEDNVAFLEVWCEEQQDVLDRVGESVFFYDDDEDDEDDEPPTHVHLRIVDLRDDLELDEETDHERKVRQMRAQIHRLRNGLPAQGGAVAGRD